MKCPRCGFEHQNGSGSFELVAAVADRRRVARGPADSGTGAVVARIPTVGNGAREFVVRESHAARFQEAYPAVDVIATLKEIAVWCECNPKQRKTASGTLRFLNTWMAKEQNGGRRG